MNESSFLNKNVAFGRWIYNLFSLHFFILIYSLKGFVIFGLPPAVAATFHIMYRWIVYREYDIVISKEFSVFYAENFWKANKIGWLLMGGSLLFMGDLMISKQMIQSQIIHILLVILFIVFLLLSAYIFPVFVRYDYHSLFAYIRQSFFIGIASLPQSIAIFVLGVLLYNVFHWIPFIALFFGAPLFIGGISWFAFQGILKAEALKVAALDKKEGKKG